MKYRGVNCQAVSILLIEQYRFLMCTTKFGKLIYATCDSPRVWGIKNFVQLYSISNVSKRAPTS